MRWERACAGCLAAIDKFGLGMRSRRGVIRLGVRVGWRAAFGLMSVHGESSGRPGNRSVVARAFWYGQEMARMIECLGQLSTANQRARARAEIERVRGPATLACRRNSGFGSLYQEGPDPSGARSRLRGHLCAMSLHVRRCKQDIGS